MKHFFIIYTNKHLILLLNELAQDDEQDKAKNCNIEWSESSRVRVRVSMLVWLNWNNINTIIIGMKWNRFNFQLIEFWLNLILLENMENKPPIPYPLPVTAAIPAFRRIREELLLQSVLTSTWCTYYSLTIIIRSVGTGRKRMESSVAFILKSKWMVISLKLRYND